MVFKGGWFLINYDVILDNNRGGGGYNALLWCKYTPVYEKAWKKTKNALMETVRYRCPCHSSPSIFCKMSLQKALNRSSLFNQYLINHPLPFWGTKQCPCQCVIKGIILPYAIIVILSSVVNNLSWNKHWNIKHFLSFYLSVHWFRLDFDCKGLPPLHGDRIKNSEAKVKIKISFKPHLYLKVKASSARSRRCCVKEVNVKTW